MLFLSEGRCLQEGPKYRGKQSIKLRIRFEREGYGLNAQLGEDFQKIKKKIKIWTTHLGGHTQGVRVTTLTTLNTDYIISQIVVFQ